MRKAIRMTVGMIVGGVSLAVGGWRSAAAQPDAAVSVEATLHADRPPGPKMDRNRQGQFAEHLGTGI